MPAGGSRTRGSDSEREDLIVTDTGNLGALTDMKSDTDRHWDVRARTVGHAPSVNIEDVYQRELELEFVCAHLTDTQRLLEVGCGNGYNTTRFRDKVGEVEAFDLSREMVDRAKVDHVHPAVRFYEASIEDPAAAAEQAFDVVVCIRTLINLPDLAAQRLAIQNMLSWLRPDGLLLLIEGFRDGFEELGALRQSLGLPPLVPASINTYSTVAEIEDLLAAGGETVATFHSGTWDLLTRVTLPLIGGTEAARGVGPLHAPLLEIARMLGNDRTEKLARVRGWAIRSRAHSGG